MTSSHKPDSSASSPASPAAGTLATQTTPTVPAHPTRPASAAGGPWLKLAGFVLIALGLVLGVASVPTAYLPPLSLDDERLVGLTLAAPAGEVRTEDMPDHAMGEPLIKPVDDDGEPVKVTAEILATLRDADVKRIKVKEFALSRWTGVWPFLGACGLLLLGALLVRTDMKQRLAAAEAAAQTNTAASPQATLAAITEAIEGLRRELPHMTTDHDRLHAIIERLGEVQSTHVPAFVDARPLLISRLGLSGYAELMDRFAAMERQVNRAWSAAADGVEDESLDCIERASALAAETVPLLHGARAGA